jgi:hypothetical protein
MAKLIVRKSTGVDPNSAITKDRKSCALMYVFRRLYY